MPGKDKGGRQKVSRQQEITEHKNRCYLFINLAHHFSIAWRASSGRSVNNQ
jgi:hypothetical protein